MLNQSAHDHYYGSIVGFKGGRSRSGKMRRSLLQKEMAQADTRNTFTLPVEPHESAPLAIGETIEELK